MLLSRSGLPSRTDWNTRSFGPEDLTPLVLPGAVSSSHRNVKSLIIRIGIFELKCTEFCLEVENEPAERMKLFMQIMGKLLFLVRRGTDLRLPSLDQVRLELEFLIG
jgi:hypothetical protein